MVITRGVWPPKPMAAAGRISIRANTTRATDIGRGIQLLENHGYQVTLKDCGWRALEYVQEHFREIDLVILDMAMPGMDGAEIYEVLKKLYPQIKVIIATGYSTDEALEDLRLEGVSGIIQKPYNDEMIKLVYELTSKQGEPL